jgi:hypothetical protein
VTHQIATAVHHGDVHWLSDFRRFGFRRRDDLPSFSQSYRDIFPLQAAFASWLCGSRTNLLAVPASKFL